MTWVLPCCAGNSRPLLTTDHPPQIADKGESEYRRRAIVPGSQSRRGSGWSPPIAPRQRRSHRAPARIGRHRAGLVRHPGEWWRPSGPPGTPTLRWQPGCPVASAGSTRHGSTLSLPGHPGCESPACVAWHRADIGPLQAAHRPPRPTPPRVPRRGSAAGRSCARCARTRDSTPRRPGPPLSPGNGSNTAVRATAAGGAPGPRARRGQPAPPTLRVCARPANPTSSAYTYIAAHHQTSRQPGEFQGRRRPRVAQKPRKNEEKTQISLATYASVC